ncbi:37S ribosomal protein S18 [Geopyxis carbonaria]|nr:37S ribosomal protein S18 [Geopyxis carbonaria]
MSVATSLKALLSKTTGTTASITSVASTWRSYGTYGHTPEKKEQIITNIANTFARTPTTMSAQEETDMRELQSSQIKFQPGDIYAPNDLSMEELKARRGNKKPAKDAFDLLGLNPIKEYKNYNLLSEYVSSMGRILHSRQTGLRPVNQRKISKAIRRAVGIGFLPSTHKHPEILRAQETQFQTRKR